MKEVTEHTIAKQHYSERSIRSFVVRSSKMSRTQANSYQRLSPKYLLPYRRLKTQGECWSYWQSVFAPIQTTGRFICEIGFGSGSLSAQIMRQNPCDFYLGIEVYRSGIANLMQQAEDSELKGLRIIEHDALEVFECMLPTSSLDGLNLFFPDPWPKKRQQKRRLVNAETLQLFYFSLKPGGYFHFVTDSQDYATTVEMVIQKELWQQSPPPKIPNSKFGDRAKCEGRTSFALYLRKCGKSLASSIKNDIKASSMQKPPAQFAATRPKTASGQPGI